MSGARLCPALLLVLDDYFSWGEFILVGGTCIVGIVMLGAALTGFMLRPMSMPMRITLAIAAIMMVSTSWQANLWAVVVAAPALVSQFYGWLSDRSSAPAKG